MTELRKGQLNKTDLTWARAHLSGTEEGKANTRESAL